MSIDLDQISKYIEKYPSHQSKQTKRRVVGVVRRIPLEFLALYDYRSDLMDILA